MPNDDPTVGDIFEVEILKHEPWGAMVRILPPGPDLPASVHLLAMWQQAGAQTWPPVGARLEAVFQRWSGSWARMKADSAMLAKARSAWGVVAIARIDLTSAEQGGLIAPLRSGRSHLSPSFATTSDGRLSMSWTAIVETLDGRDLTPGEQEVPIRLRLWEDDSLGGVSVGTPVEFRYKGPSGPNRVVARGVITALA